MNTQSISEGSHGLLNCSGFLRYKKPHAAALTNSTIVKMYSGFI